MKAIWHIEDLFDKDLENGIENSGLDEFEITCGAAFALGCVEAFYSEEDSKNLAIINVKSARHGAYIVYADAAMVNALFIPKNKKRAYEITYLVDRQNYNGEYLYKAKRD